MAVEKLTDYTRRIWTALDADAPEGHDFEVGDVIYYMDSSQCGIVTYVYPEGSIDVEFLPDIGGGGGGGVEYKNVTFRAVNTLGSTVINAHYVSENSGVPTAIAQALPLNSEITLHIQIVNGNIQMFSQTATTGWEAYYNNSPLPMLPATNRSLMFELPTTYTPGEIITLQHKGGNIK